MSKKGILLAITHGTWLINESAVAGFASQVVELLNGKAEPGASAFWGDWDKSDPKYLCENKLTLVSADRSPYFSKDLSFSNASKNSVLIISMDGPLMKHDNCGDPGAKTYETILKAANKNKNICAVVMAMDGPGGTVDGTESLANTLSAMNIPVVTHTDGMICSAHYWLASNTKFVIAASNTCQVGSIGVATNFFDYSKMWEEMGIKEHYVVAEGSEDKNRAYMEARAGKYEAYKKEILNPLRAQFVAAVEKNRGSKIKLSKENVLSGKVYIAADAVENGLIDSIGTLDEAVEKAFELAEVEPKTTSKKTQNANMKTVTLTAQHAAIMALFGLKLEAGKDSVELEMNADNLAKLDSALSAGTKAATDLATAKTDLEAKTKAVTTAEEKATKAEADLETLKKSNPGAISAKKEGDDKVETETDSDAEVWNLPHNKAVLDNPLFN